MVKAKNNFMHTTLCLDFGNTRLKCAVFNNDDVKELITLNDDSNETIQNLISTYKPDKSILSSVINHNPEIENILSAKTKFHKLTHQSKLSFSTPVGKPETIGADRLALIAAAVHFFPDKHNLVIGLGSIFDPDTRALNLVRVLNAFVRPENIEVFREFHSAWHNLRCSGAY